MHGQLLHYILAILGAAGLGGVAAVLRVFFSRHKHIAVKFSETGELIQADGLSAGDIIRLLKERGQHSQASSVPPAEVDEAMRPPNYQVLQESSSGPSQLRNLHAD